MSTDRLPSQMHSEVGIDLGFVVPRLTIGNAEGGSFPFPVPVDQLTTAPSIHISAPAAGRCPPINIPVISTPSSSTLYSLPGSAQNVSGLSTNSFSIPSSTPTDSIGTPSTPVAEGIRVALEMMGSSQPDLQFLRQRLTVSEINSKIEERFLSMECPSPFEGMIHSKLLEDHIPPWIELIDIEVAKHSIIGRVNRMVLASTPSVTTAAVQGTGKRIKQNTANLMFAGRFCECFAAELIGGDHNSPLAQTINAKAQEFAEGLHEEFNCQMSATGLSQPLFEIVLVAQSRWRVAMNPIAPPEVRKMVFTTGLARRIVCGPDKRMQKRINIRNTDLGRYLHIIRKTIQRELDETGALIDPLEARKMRAVSSPQRAVSLALFWCYFLSDDLFHSAALRDMPLDPKQVTQAETGTRTRPAAPTSIVLDKNQKNELAVSCLGAMVKGADTLGRRGGLGDIKRKSVTATVRLGSALLARYGSAHGLTSIDARVAKKSLMKAILAHLPEVDWDSPDMAALVHDELRPARPTLVAWHGVLATVVGVFGLPTEVQERIVRAAEVGLR